MKFVLFRHAHKGIAPYDDPELSIQGFEQASLILDLVKTAKIPQPTHLFVSPKRRTSQTFYPISKEFILHTQILSDLDQQSAKENNGEFKKRIMNFLTFLAELETPEMVIYACTHFDWIEEAMTLINSDKDLNSFEFSHWSPAQHLVFERQLDLWKLQKKGTVK